LKIRKVRIKLGFRIEIGVIIRIGITVVIIRITVNIRNRIGIRALELGLGNGVEMRLELHTRLRL
jgi:hypothetical protein